jgi:hypothetical protein
MGSQGAPDLYVFAQRLRANTNNIYVLAIALWFGESELKLSRKTMAGMAGCSEAHVAATLILFKRFMRMEDAFGAHSFIHCYKHVIAPAMFPGRG